eukprot:gene22578-biopygen1187
MEEANPGWFMCTPAMRTFIAESLPSCSLEHKGRAQGMRNAYPPTTIFQQSNPTHNGHRCNVHPKRQTFCWYLKERRCTEKTRPQCSCSGTCAAAIFVVVNGAAAEVPGN